MWYPDSILLFSVAEKTVHGYLQKPPSDTAAAQQKEQKFIIRDHGQVGWTLASFL